jgi:hypothetical protein
MGKGAYPTAALACFKLPLADGSRLNDPIADGGRAAFGWPEAPFVITLCRRYLKVKGRYA